jgi:very-short-patch-repair endonuclease
MIEIDGESHFVDGAPEYDRERQAFIEATSIRFLRFTNLGGVLEMMRKVWELRSDEVLQEYPPTSSLKLRLIKGGVRG